MTFVSLAVAGVSVGIAAWRNWRDITRYVSHRLQTYNYQNSSDPVTRGLATGEFGPGYPVERLIEQHSPRFFDRHDEFVTLRYVPEGCIGGTEVIAKDGKVVFAIDGWCSHAHVFFNAMSDADWLAYDRSYGAVLDLKRERQSAPPHAVAGTAAVAFNEGYYSTPETP